MAPTKPIALMTIRIMAYKRDIFLMQLGRLYALKMYKTAMTKKTATLIAGKETNNVL